jgi:diaminopimelate decarboxylase
MMRYGEFIESVDGQLTIDGVNCVQLAEQYGTPLFIISENTLRSNYRKFFQAFQSRYPAGVVVCVGMKANYGVAVRKIIVQEGGGGDAFGLGELYVALLVGSDPQKIVMNGANKSDTVLNAAIESDIIINVDSLGELITAGSIAERLQKQANICLRIRLPLEQLAGKHYIDPRYGPPGIDISKWEREFKFGMEPQQIYEAVDFALKSPGIQLQGLMYHGGIPRRAGYYREEVAELMDYISIIKSRLGWEPQLLDLGGGFAPFRVGKEAPPSLDDYARSITDTIQVKAKQYGLSLPKLFLEPGRWCLENAVVYLVQVGNIKSDTKITQKKWVYVDGNINEMGDPFDPYVTYHHAVLANDTSAPEEEVADICGQLCNAADILASGRKIPRVENGDLLAFLDMGAYNESFANQSNAMPRSASVLVSGGKAAIARRRETIQDIISREVVPYWLLKI